VIRLTRATIAATAAALAATVLPLALGACGSDSASADPNVTHRDYDRDNFSDSTNIDNEWSPLVPGTQFTYEGRSNRGEGRLPHRVVFTVTDLVKEIDGVETVVMWDRDYNAGKLLEGELAFFAQDDDGNVWNMGEYPEEYDEEGKFEGAPDTWIAGLEGAKAGILMRADPKVGTPSYRQGLAPKIEFADVAKVYRTGQRSCVPGRCYDDVLVTDETNPLEPADGHQLKYYAPDVGNIRAAPGKGGKEREILVLVKVTRLPAGALFFVRKEALKLERRAYRKPFYRRTPRAKRASET
jgi:ketosteroid isomerase-like protein